MNYSNKAGRKSGFDFADQEELNELAMHGVD